MNRFGILILLNFFLAGKCSGQALNWWYQFDNYQVEALDVDSAGNVFMGGTINDTLDIDPTTGVEMILPNYNDGFLVKFDAAGNYQWVHHLLGNAAQNIHACKADNNGNIFIACDFDGHSFGVRKLNLFGQAIWTKIFNHSTSSQGDFSDCFDVSVDNDGNCLLAGNFYGLTTFNVNPPISLNSSADRTAFISKQDTTGNTLWVKILYGTDQSKAYSVANDDSGNVYVTGLFYGTTDFDPDSAAVFNVTANPSGGAFDQDIFVLKLSPDGEFMWVHTYIVYSPPPPEIQVDPFNDLIITGKVQDDLDPGPGYAGVTGAFILKLNSDGNFIWARGFNGGSGASVAVNQFGNIVASGMISTSNFDLDPGPGFDTVATPQGGGYIVKLNQNGSYLGGGVFQGGTAKRAAITNDFDFYVAGLFYDTIDVDISQNVLNGYAQNGTQDIFLVKYSDCGYSSATQYLSGCDTVFANGQPYFYSGTYFQTYVDTAGCDSTIILDIVVNHSYNHVFSISGCDSAAFNGQYYFTTGVTTQYLTTAGGCDSIISVYADISNSSQQTFNFNVCDNLVFNGQTYSSTGIYFQTLTNSEGCDSLITINLTIDPIDTSVINIFGGLYAGQSNAGYQWLNCDSAYNPIPGATTQTFYPLVNGNYAVLVSYMGCQDTSACFVVSNVGVDEISSMTFDFNPNPVSSLLYINTTVALTNASIEIVNILGSIITKKQNLNGVSNSVDLSNLEAGIYLVRIHSEKTTFMFRVLKTD